MQVSRETQEPGVTVSGSMKYDVTRRGPDGQEIVTVTAKTGDEAAEKAFKAGTIIVGVTPNKGPELITEAPRPLTLQGSADGATPKEIEDQVKKETEANPSNAERLAGAEQVLEHGTTNAVGIENQHKVSGPSGTAVADLPPPSKNPVGRPPKKQD